MREFEYQLSHPVKEELSLEMHHASAGHRNPAPEARVTGEECARGEHEAPQPVGNPSFATSQLTARRLQ